MKESIKKWFIAAGKRAAKTAAQVSILVIGTQTGAQIVEGGFNVFTMDWLTILGFALGGAVLSLLTSTVGIAEVENGESLVSLAKKGEGDV